MQKSINIGKEKESVEQLTLIRFGEKENGYVKLLNSHIVLLNTILGKKVFKNNVLYVGYDTLWEIMQPIGGRGKHNYHGLTPQDVYVALKIMKDSVNVEASYDGRYIIVTLATINDGANIVVIVSPNVELGFKTKNKVTKIITIYPMKVKK